MRFGAQAASAATSMRKLVINVVRFAFAKVLITGDVLSLQTDTALSKLESVELFTAYGLQGSRGQECNSYVKLPTHKYDQDDDFTGEDVENHQ